MHGIIESITFLLVISLMFSIESNQIRQHQSILIASMRGRQELFTENMNRRKKVREYTVVMTEASSKTGKQAAIIPSMVFKEQSDSTSLSDEKSLMERISCETPAKTSNPVSNIPKPAFFNLTAVRSWFFKDLAT